MQTTGVFEPFNDRKGKGWCIFYNWNIKQPQIFVFPYKVIKLIVNTFFDATLLKFFPTTARARFISSYFFLFTDNRCCNRILIWYSMFFKINLINQTCSPNISVNNLRNNFSTISAFTFLYLSATSFSGFSNVSVIKLYAAFNTNCG